MPARRFQGAGGHPENSGQRSPAKLGTSSPSAIRRTADAKRGLSPTSSPRHPRSAVPQPLGRVVQVPTMSQRPHSPGRSVSPFIGGPGKSTTTSLPYLSDEKFFTCPSPLCGPDHFFGAVPHFTTRDPH